MGTKKREAEKITMRFTSFVVCLALVAAVAVTARHVPVPFGRMREECVRNVPSGAVITVVNENKTIVYDPATDTETIYGPCDTQFQPLRKASLAGNGANRKLLEYDGWLGYTQWENTAGSGDIASFLGSFSVPNAPKRDPEVLYIFTGLQDDDWVPLLGPAPSDFDIIQPVLQYPAEGGNYWSVRSWYVTLTGGSLVSDEIPLSVGGTVFGNMTRVGPTSYYIGSTNTATGKTTSLTVNKPRLKNQNWAFTTVECYGCDGCDWLPTNDCDFTDMTLASDSGPLTATWAAEVSPNPKCHTTAHVTDSATVTYSFQSSSDDDDQ